MKIKRIIDIKNSIAVVELEGESIRYVTTNSLKSRKSLLRAYKQAREHELQEYRNHGL